MTVTARDTPVVFEFVAQTQSSREVEIRARVAGFLEKRLYTEGELVKAGQVLFQMDRRPFEAALLSAQGQLAQQQARWEVAKATLARVRPLAQQNAVSKMDLDNAVGNERQTQAAVLAAQGQVRTEQLNLGYTTIASPLTGLSSFAKKQEGSYVTPGESGLLTSVSQMDPIYVNFSLSENETLKYRSEIAAGQLKFPPNSNFEVEVVLADGSIVPDRGRLDFAAPSFSPETGTFLVRAVVANPKGMLRPGQFVRALAIGASRPNAVLVPQRAVLEGARSRYVWVINGESKPEQRIVEVGDWHDADWFITQGLRAGERIVVDGALRVAPGAPLNIVDNAVAAPPSAAIAAERPKAASLPVQKDPLKADLPGNENRRQP
ncbi:MAG: efflux RND transporter periplasmic adaptor subunit [Pseudomonas sp.]|uniref:efflux RND transporter periplasmic adaptor subunit n=1 Tax=Pseudomonas sp. UMAB-08 TaxID=1365375 RepID=UPI001C58BE11|nr:efflux RND transporter periplasmic adaptor subunit [Pseudomonas sp. UMAB-08]